VKVNRLLLLFLFIAPLHGQTRPRARDLGITIGSIPTGPLDAITDVAGIRVGHTTITRGDSINTGITAILPHGGNPFRDKVPAAIVVGNGFGKLAGSTQVNELGELESPIVLTCTLCVPRAADAVLTWLLNLPGNEDVRSANPVVAETNDGYLNDIRARPITETDVLSAINGAASGPVAEGSVGAGRGTVAFGWKGGIGTSSRKLPAASGGWTVGVLVRRNALLIFMSVELQLNAVNLALVAFSRQAGNLTGQVLAFFSMVVAAAEVVVGLAIIVSLYRKRHSSDVDDARLLKW